MDTLKVFCLCLIIVPAIQANPAAIPYIEVSEEHLKIKAGESASVKCNPGGNPLPVVQWKKHEGEFGDGTKISGTTLTIERAQDSDRGYYVCVGVVGNTDVAQKYVYVEIESPPSRDNLKVTVSQETLTIPLGGTGSVECTPEGNPMAEVQWVKADGEFRDGIRQSGNTLIISDARVEDRGHYVCQGIVDGTVMLTSYVAVNIEDVDSSAQSDPKVSVSQRTLIITRGGRGTIECTPEGNPLPSVQWIKSDGEFRDGISQSGNTLIISNAREDDRGHYVCQGIVDGTVMFTSYVAVNVEDASPPSRDNFELTVSQQTLSIPRGGRGSVECTPEGNPLPEVQWVKADGEFRDGIRQSGNTLIISDARVEDRGHYVCQGIVDGTVMLTSYVAVNIEDVDSSAQSDPKVSVSQRTLIIPRGGRGTIECTPEGNPLPSVQWIKSDGAFRDGISQSGNTLIISNAREDDQGHYVCQGIVDGTVIFTSYVAVNVEDASPPSRDNFELTVSQQTLSIPRGGRGSVECTPEGNPLPEVQWVKADGEFRDGIRQSGNTLIISDARVEDRGHYVCQGIVDGTVMLTSYVAVNIEDVDPSAQSDPKVSVSQRTLIIPRGGRGTIECTPEGNPLPSVQWIKSDGEFRDGISQSGNTLIISNAREDDRGHYVCQGIVDGTVMFTSYVAVNVEDASPPSRDNFELTVSHQTLSIPRGGRGSVECTPEGNPLPEVQWVKADGEFHDGIRQNGNTLIISDARVEDRGHYVCQGIVDGTVMLTSYVAVNIEDVDPSAQSDPKVSVSQRTLIIPRGGRGTIECTPEGNPLPSVQWIKSDGAFRDGISQSGNTLIISNAREDDQGHYVCQGIVDGTVIFTSYVAVNVEDASPPSRDNFELTVSQQTLSIPRGGRGSVECTPEGNPLPEVQWVKADGEFHDGIRQSGNTLIISDARVEDRGHYVCQGIVDGTVMLTSYVAVNIEDVDPSAQSDPKVSVSQRTLIIPRGGRGTIECTPEGNPLPSVQWIKSDGEFRDGISQSGNTLIISDARVEDRGHYVCQGIVDGTVMSTNYSAVEIGRRSESSGNPKVTVSKQQQIIPVGGSGSIECIPEGNPLPTIRWIKSDGEFRNGIGQSGNTLIISDARKEDRGHYACQGIVDGTVMVTDYSAVDIKSNEGISDQLPKPIDAVILEGQNFKMSCDFVTGDHEEQVTWSRGDQVPLPRNAQVGQELVILGATKEDSGNYLCKVTASGGFLLRAAVVRLAVVARPLVAARPPVQTATRGDSVTVECVTDAVDALVTWDRVNGSLSRRVQTLGQGSKLYFTGIEVEDAGYYRCSVRNIAGISSGIAQVLVNDVPTSSPANLRTSSSNVIVSHRQLTIPRGERVSIECTPEGNPLPIVQWIKSDGEFRDGISQSGNMLIISDARVEDRGHYVCQGIVDGTVMVTDYSAIDIKNVPQTSSPANLRSSNVIVSHRQLTIPRGERVSIECTPEGNPLPIVQWIKSDGEFRDGISQSGNMLIISDARVEDRGHYVCQGIVDGTVMVTDYSAIDIKNVPQTSSPANLRSSNVIVSHRQLTIPRGERVSIECTPEGNPLPIVQWIKSDGEFRDGISQSGNMLIISDARVEDRGHYVCQGIVDGTVMVTDYSAIDIKNVPQTSSPANLRSSNVIVSHRQLTIPRGERVSIECTPEGNPLPIVQWIKSDGEFRDGISQSGNMLIISDARVEDRGHYVCQGIVDGTVMVTDYSTVDIENEDRPPVVAGDSRVELNVRQVTIPKGGNRTVECTPQGNPLPSIQSSKIEGEFGVGTRQSGNSLIISDAQQQDGGYYVCDGMVDGTAAWADYLSVDIENICELPNEVGRCQAAFDRWFYDSTQQKCQQFTWGGCGGNKNNFETEEQCSLECEGRRPNAA